MFFYYHLLPTEEERLQIAAKKQRKLAAETKRVREKTAKLAADTELKRAQKAEIMRQQSALKLEIERQDREILKVPFIFLLLYQKIEKKIL